MHTPLPTIQEPPLPHLGIFWGRVVLFTILLMGQHSVCSAQSVLYEPPLGKGWGHLSDTTYSQEVQQEIETIMGQGTTWDSLKPEQLQQLAALGVKKPQPVVYPEEKYVGRWTLYAIEPADLQPGAYQELLGNIKAGETFLYIRDLNYFIARNSGNEGEFAGRWELTNMGNALRLVRLGDVPCSQCLTDVTLDIVAYNNGQLALHCKNADVTLHFEKQ